MYLSMSMIAQYLQHYHPHCHITEDTRTIRGIRFMTEQNPCSSKEYVYLGKANEYIQDPKYKNALILANGENQLFCHCETDEQLLNDVLSAFDIYNEMEQRLHEAALERQPLANMLSNVELLLPGPLFVFGLDGKLLASLHMEEFAEKAILKSIHTTKSFDATVVGKTFLDKEGHISHDLSDEPQLLHEKGNTSPGCIGMYLTQNKKRIGYILHFPPTADTAMMHFSRCMELLLASYLTSSAEFTGMLSLYTSTQSLMLRLLEGEDLSPFQLKACMELLSLKGNGVLLVIQNHSIQNYTFRTILMTAIGSQPFPCLLCEYHEQVVLFLEKTHLEPILRFLKQQISLEMIAIGVSMPVQSLKNLASAYQQATFALTTTKTTGIHYCRQLAFPYLIQTLKANTSTPHLLHPLIPILLQYDHENQGELFHTLQVYLNTGCSQSKAAKVLHIHLNTLKYRLRRISELGQIDILSSSELLYLHLSTVLAAAQKSKEIDN